MKTFFKLDIPKSASWKAWGEIYDKLKKSRPIAFFLYRTLPIFLRVKFRRYVEDPKDFIISRFVKKDHLIDLRKGPCFSHGGFGQYNWGYISPSDTLVVSCYRSLERYVEEYTQGYESFEAKISALEIIAKTSKYPHDIEHLNNIKKLHEIYCFFQDLYKNSDDILKHNSAQDMLKREEEINKKLIDLIKLRTELY